MANKNPLLNINPKVGYSAKELLTLSDDQKVNTRLKSLYTGKIFTTTQDGYMGSDILENYNLYGNRLGVSQRLAEITGLARSNVWLAIRSEGLDKGNIANISRTDKKKVYVFEKGIDVDDLAVKIQESYGRLQGKKRKVVGADDRGDGEHVLNCIKDRRILMGKAVREVALPNDKWLIALHQGVFDSYLERRGKDYYLKEGRSKEEVSNVLMEVRDSFRLRRLPSMLGVQLRGFRRYFSTELLENNLKLVMGKGDNSYYIFREDRKVVSLLTGLQNEEKSSSDWNGVSILKKRTKRTNSKKKEKMSREVERSTSKDSGIKYQHELLEEILGKRPGVSEDHFSEESPVKLTGRAAWDALGDDDDPNDPVNDPNWVDDDTIY
jgi:hypothetical protein